MFFNLAANRPHTRWRAAAVRVCGLRVADYGGRLGTGGAMRCGRGERAEGQKAERRKGGGLAHTKGRAVNRSGMACPWRAVFSTWWRAHLPTIPTPKPRQRPSICSRSAHATHESLQQSCNNGPSAHAKARKINARQGVLNPQPLKSTGETHGAEGARRQHARRFMRSLTCAGLA